MEITLCAAIDCKKQIPLFLTQTYKRRLLKRASATRLVTCEKTNWSYQRATFVPVLSLQFQQTIKDAPLPSDACSLFRIQTAFRSVMMRNSNTPIFSQEFCFPDKLGLPDSTTPQPIHSESSDYFTTALDWVFVLFDVRKQKRRAQACRRF